MQPMEISEGPVTVKCMKAKRRPVGSCWRGQFQFAFLPEALGEIEEKGEIARGRGPARERDRLADDEAMDQLGRNAITQEIVMVSQQFQASGGGVMAVEVGKLDLEQKLRKGMGDCGHERSLEKLLPANIPSAEEQPSDDELESLPLRSPTLAGVHLNGAFLKLPKTNRIRCPVHHYSNIS